MGKYTYKNWTPTTKNQEVYKRVVNKFPTRGVYSSFPDKIWAVDLVDMSTNPSSGFKYILNAVDVYSRKAYARNMKSKNADDISKAVDSIIKEAKHPPMYIWSDKEGGLLSKVFKQQFPDIKIYNTHNETKASTVEAFNKTMKTEMQQQTDMKKWDKFVPHFIGSYNNTKHSSTGVAPNEGKNGNSDITNANAINAFEMRKETKNEFSIGDKVRISLVKGKFDKGYAQRWSDEIFTICKIENTTPTTYKIKDNKGEIIEGGFYKQQLQKTNS